jgi:flagellar basal-body rod protein FlgB
MSVTNARNDLLARLLDVATLRQEVIAQNVANVNTPGYREQGVAFEEELGRALSSGNEAAAHRVQPHVTTPPGGPERADGNNVDVDVEMARLQKNSLLYQVYTQLLAMHLGKMRSAISGH